MGTALAIRFSSWDAGAVRALALSVALTCGIALAMLAAYLVVLALTPVVVGCCTALVAFGLAAAPVVGKLAVGLAVVAVYAWWFRP